MLTRRNAPLLAIATATTAAVVASGAWAMSQPPLPGAGYVWAQPSASLVGVTSAEPVPATSAASMLPVVGYVWAQPDTSVIAVASTQS